jgi:hypothetical protein
MMYKGICVMYKCRIIFFISIRQSVVFREEYRQLKFENFYFLIRLWILITAKYQGETL